MIYVLLAIAIAIVILLLKFVYDQKQKLDLLSLEISRQGQNPLSNVDTLKSVFYETSTYVSNQAVVQALEHASRTLLEQAGKNLSETKSNIESLLTPIVTGLNELKSVTDKLDEQLIEKYSVLTEQLRSLKDSEARLEQQANNLIGALKNPQARGRWGEVQLRRVVELSGMVQYCDFFEQQSIGEQGKMRPDLIIKLPNNNQVAVDAKVPMEAYLRYIQEQDPDQAEQALSEHCKQLRAHITALGGKNYWETLGQVEFVVAFISPESALNVALGHDLTLVDFAVEKKVLLAGPTSLVALLKAIHYGWRQESMYENAKEITKLGNDLYQRLLTFVNRFEDVGKNLEKTVVSYNQAVGSFENRLVPQARKFQNLTADTHEIQDAYKIERNIRALNVGDNVSDNAY